MTTTKVCPFRSSPARWGASLCKLSFRPHRLSALSGRGSIRLGLGGIPKPNHTGLATTTDNHGNQPPCHQREHFSSFPSPSSLPFTCFPVPTRSQSSDMTASPSLRLSPATEGRDRPTRRNMSCYIVSWHQAASIRRPVESGRGDASTYMK